MLDALALSRSSSRGTANGAAAPTDVFQILSPHRQLSSGRLGAKAARTPSVHLWTRRDTSDISLSFVFISTLTSQGGRIAEVSGLNPPGSELFTASQSPTGPIGVL